MKRREKKAKYCSRRCLWVAMIRKRRNTEIKGQIDEPGRRRNGAK